MGTETSVRVEHFLDDLDVAQATHNRTNGPYGFPDLPILVKFSDGRSPQIVGVRSLRAMTVRAIAFDEYHRAYTFEEISPEDDGPWYDSERMSAVIIEVGNPEERAETDE